MSGILNLREIKRTRKTHTCNHCDRTIPKGSPATYGFGDLYDEGRIEAAYLCIQCSPHPLQVSVTRRTGGTVQRIADPETTVIDG